MDKDHGLSRITQLKDQAELSWHTVLDSFEGFQNNEWAIRLDDMLYHTWWQVRVSESTGHRVT
eukprot:2624405-Pyramimonas_sp.AAC.1